MMVPGTALKYHDVELHRRQTSRRDNSLSVATFGQSCVTAIEPDWRDLAGRCIEDNVYYARHYAKSLLDTVESGTDVRYVTVWDHDRLIAFLPVVLRKHAIPGILPAGAAWQSDYTFSCTPMLDKDQPDRAAGGLVDALAALRAGDWAIPQMNVGGAAWRALTGALDQREVPWLRHRMFERASLSAGPGFEEHMRAAISAKRRRELARNRRRLEELGTVTHKSCNGGAELDEAVEAFLALEAGGWKGARGTALASRKDTTQFAKAAFGAVAAGRSARADVLLLDGKPIAAGVIVFSGSTGFTVKGAYDEAYASYSAGLLLEVEVLKSFLEERWAARLDAATNGSHVIDRFWPDRVSVGELAFSFAPTAPRLRLSAYERSQSLWASAKAGLKRIAGR